MTKFTGETGGIILKEELYKELAERFSPAFLEEIQPEEGSLSCRKEIQALKNISCCFHDVSEGGIYAALYELAEGYKCGFRADLKKIPVKQETIEICEHFGLDPYTLFSTGCLLVTVRDKEQALKALAEAGVPACEIGRVLKGRQKILVKGDEEANMERPQRDAVYRAESFG